MKCGSKPPAARIRHSFVMAAMNVAAILLVLPTDAIGQATTVGDSVGLFRNSLRAIETLMLGAVFLVGVAMTGSGLMRLTAIGSMRSDPDRSDVLAAILRLGGGTILAGIPAFLVIAQTTLFQRNIETWAAPGAGGVRSCIGQGGGLVCVIQNLERNLVGITLDAVNMLAILVAIWFAYTAVRALAQNKDGPSNAQVNPWARFVLAACLANFPIFISTIARTLGAPTSMGIGDSGELIKTDDMLLYGIIGGRGVAAEGASRLFASALMLLAMFGVIAVFRGVWLFKRAAEQGADGATGSALTHVIGGTLLINMQWTICVVARTVFGKDWGFCG